MTPLALFAVDPLGLGGVVLRGAPSRARDKWLAALAACLPAPPRRLPPSIDDARLLGGLDVAATLAAGRPVASGGLLAEAHGGVVLVPMAERLGEGVAGRLANVLDTGEVVVERDGASGRAAARLALVLLDEGEGDDERAPDALTERLAFRVEAEGADADLDPAAIAAARARLATVATPGPEVLAALCGTALLLGVDSARGVMFALRAARAAAALAGRDRIDADDVTLAAQLVLSPRATRLPPAEAQGDAPQPPTPDGGDAEKSGGDGDDESVPSADALTEIVLAAAKAALPAKLLEGGAARARRRRGGQEGGRGAGERRLSWRRGRPVGTRGGMPGGGKRLALAATLAAAAVWQRARRGEAEALLVDRHSGEGRNPVASQARSFAPLTKPGSGLRRNDEKKIIIRRDDLRIRRFETRMEATVIVVVDASGSAALARLAEAKGAVELLLAQAYVLRTQVALIAFRGSTAELLLPPTRSLTRARRALGELAGGGGTPLAAGLDAALALALSVRSRGRTPRLVLLTDGRGNVARDPAAGRAQAGLDADGAARALVAAGVAGLLIDTAPRPRAETAAFAGRMGARYLALPRVDAEGVAAAALAA